MPNNGWKKVYINGITLSERQQIELDTSRPKTQKYIKKTN